MLKILVHGCSGQMGRTLKSIIENDDTLIFYGFNRNQSTEDKIFNSYEDIPQVDIVIDFSHYKAIDSLLDFACKRKIPLVLGTTGLEDTIKSNIGSASKTIPIFQSNNMSLGIQTLLEMAKIAIECLDDFDLEIVEKHHNKKVDAPSGTAQLIFDTLQEKNNQLQAVFGRRGRDQKRQKNDIGIHSIRGGNIVGEHSIIFAGLDEQIEIKHVATSKKNFAFGAIEAAKFLYRQPPGLYNMSHIYRKDKA